MKSSAEIHNYYKECFDNPSSRYSRMMKEFVNTNNISRETRVLDYGCGTGLVSHYLYKQFKCKIDAVDISKDEIEAARLAWDKDDICWLTMDEFTYPESEYDFVISSQVIEHIHNVGNYLAVINRMLKEDGNLIIGTPNVITPGLFWRQMRCKEESLKAWSRQMIIEYDKGMDHINAWDTHHFVTLLASCGFELERYLPTEGVPIPKFRFMNIIPPIRKMGGGICR